MEKLVVKKRVAVYVRVSTEEQRDYGYSIPGQIRELTEYCKRKNYEIVDIYNDAGHSARDLRRPNMERMLEDIKNGKVDIIVSTKTDRLTREGYDGHWLLKFCKEYDCLLDLLYESFDVNTPDGEMMFGINILFAQRERRETARRTKIYMEEAAVQGKHPAKAPYGYIKTKDKTLEPDPITSIIVKDIYDMYLKGMSSIEIMDKLKDDERYTNYFNIRPQTIIGIIKNPVYKGDLAWGHTKRKKADITYFEEHHTPLVSKEIWEKAQDQILRNTNGGYGEKIHIFTGIIKCPECHKSMSNYFSRKNKNKRVKLTYYVHCQNKNCSKYKTLYNTGKVEKCLLPLLQDLSVFALLNDKIINVPKLKGKNELVNYEKSLEELKKKENNLINLFTDDRVSKELLDSKLNHIIKERDNINQKIEVLNNDELFKFNGNIEELFENRTDSPNYDISNIWNILSRKTKKDIVQKYVKEIEVNIDDNYNITIEKIIFYNDFMQNKLFTFRDFLLQKVKERNDTFELKGMLNEKEFNEFIKNNKSAKAYDFAEIVKYKAYEYENELSDIEKLKQDKSIQIFAISNDNKNIDRFKIVVPN